LTIEGVIPKEVAEGPAAIRATVRDTRSQVRAAAAMLRARGVKRIWVLGNGTSYHSSLHASGLARRLAGPADPLAIPVTAGDFITFRPHLGDGDAVIAISASGEFRDVLGVIRDIRGRIPTVGITNVQGSSLTQISDQVVISSGGASDTAVMKKTFSATLSATILTLASTLGEECLSIAEDGLLLAADHADSTIAAAWPIVETLATELSAAEHIFVVGGGLAYPAALEAALKLKEMALVHAEASETWEMASGPSTMVGPKTVVVSLAPEGPARAATDDVARHCRSWGAPVIEVAASSAVPNSRLLTIPLDVDERFAPLTLVPPVALLGYVLANLRGATPDRPDWVERYRMQGLTHIAGA
jgi:glutamine---fructose-6-phosphate transaminase (isomerizing)